MSRWLPLLLLIAACAVFWGNASRVAIPKTDGAPHNTGVRKLVEINNETFLFSMSDEQTWHNARYNCVLNGMQLVTLDSPERWDMIADFILANPEFNAWTWTAGYKGAGSEHFVWDTTGDNFTYTDWNLLMEEPNVNPAVEACVNFHAVIGGWYDDRCSSVQIQYMCETIPQ